MPYAQPPVGDLRFRNPVPLNTTWTDSKNATEYSPECYGYGSDQWVLGNVISEDCLTINVVRPSGVSEGADLPVGVWIHGGGFTEGGSRDPRYNQSYIIKEATDAGMPFIGHSARPSAIDSGYGTMYKRAAAYGGDVVMHAPRRYLSEIWAANDLTSYSYVFNVLTAGNNEYIGATHFTEVAFVFYNLLGDGYNNSVATDPFLDKPESYKQLARVMTRMWASFIVNQTPNEYGATALKWPEYTLGNAQNIVFDANVTELAYPAPDTYRAEGIAYLTSLYNATA
ncbi:hypothetical protein AM588_10010284 [Phytophthora nicotianae]|uniref:Carboxylesterase type B domain-containing protein n=1 Tax=Phytophthora nicotianae TaxID=4792 RepID=A0A0W8DQN8_PHYNI|nr:hypothetical protein AM588_10010284 [Phytophthora nicotianae]